MSETDRRPAAPRLTHYWWLVGGMAALFLALYFVVEWLGLPLLTDPSDAMAAGGVAAAAAGVGLLIVDLLLPVPSSLVMVAHGALFGIWVGALLSVVGSLGAVAAGYLVGRRGVAWVLAGFPGSERRRADRLIERWGALAVLVTRPVPILAEVVAVMAGAAGMGLRRVLAASTAGILPAAVLYAVTGATAARLDSTIAVFAVVLAVAGLFWLLGRRAGRGADRRPGVE